MTECVPADPEFAGRTQGSLDPALWESDMYHHSADEGGPGIGLWIGVGIVVLIGVVVVRGRSARAKRAEVGSDNEPDSAPAVLSSASNVPKIPQSSLGEGTTSRPSAARSATSAASTTVRIDGVDVLPTADSAPLQPPRRLGRFTPPPTLTRFAVIPLLASFILAYLAIRTAGDNTMSAAIPLALVSFVALGVAFYLAPAS